MKYFLLFILSITNLLADSLYASVKSAIILYLQPTVDLSYVIGFIIIVWAIVETIKTTQESGGTVFNKFLLRMMVGSLFLAFPSFFRSIYNF